MEHLELDLKPLNNRERLTIDEFFANGRVEYQAYLTAYQCSESNAIKKATRKFKKLREHPYFLNKLMIEDAKFAKLAEDHGITLIGQIGKLERVYDLALEGETALIGRGEDAIPVVQRDLKAAIAAVAEQNKICGLHAATKVDLNSKNLNVNVDVESAEYKLMQEINSLTPAEREAKLLELEEAED